MRAIEFYATELFFRLQKRFPESVHQEVFGHLLTTYCPLNWPLLTDEERLKFHRMEATSSIAAGTREILIPLLIGDSLELFPVLAPPEDILNARRIRAAERAAFQAAANAPAAAKKVHRPKRKTGAAAIRNSHVKIEATESRDPVTDVVFDPTAAAAVAGQQEFEEQAGAVMEGVTGELTEKAEARRAAAAAVDEEEEHQLILSSIKQEVCDITHMDLTDVITDAELASVQAKVQH